MDSPSTDEGGHRNVSGHRYTREDLSKLPHRMLENRTPEDLNKLFDRDGYLSPEIAGGMEAGLGNKVSSMAESTLARHRSHDTNLLDLLCLR